MNFRVRGAILIFTLLNAECFAQETLPQLSERLSEINSLKKEKVQSFLQSNASRLILINPGDPNTLISDINSFGRPVYRITLNAEAAVTTGASMLQSGIQTGLQLTGEGMTIGVWDNGQVKDHIELGQRVIANEGTTPMEHATHVTGILIAEGINPAAKGMAPQAKAAAYYLGRDDEVMAALATPDESTLLFSNHSYGTATGWFRNGNSWQWTADQEISTDEDYRFGFYSERAQTLDQIAYLAPYYSIFWATGNDRSDTGDGSFPPDCNAGTGYDCIIPDAVAKNVFTIGAVNKVLNYTSPSSVPMSTYSSWGPTDDGRIKPDLVGAGTDLFSLNSAGTNTYTTLSGTSMATPNVAGSLLLVQELYSKLHGGHFMKSATLKALAIQTAKETGSFPGPDYSFGWGLTDAVQAVKVLLSEDGNSVQVKEFTLENSDKIEIGLTPVGSQKITATIAWTDPPGAPVKESLDPGAPMLINDLDLRIVDEAGNEQKPWILDPLNPSRQAFKGDNFRDNVEKIEFTPTESKSYKLIVSHKGLLVNGKQDFSLVLTYQPSSTPATYYWVGNSGNWTDGNHWSLSSGGTAALNVPAETDRIIIDENSFDSTGTNEIVLDADMACRDFVWITSKAGSLNLNGKSLTIKNTLKVSTPHSVFTNGSIKCVSAGEGEIFWNSSAHQDIMFLVDGGNWIWSGNADVKGLTLASGGVEVNKSMLKLEELIANSSSPKELNLQLSEIKLTRLSEMDGNAFILDASGSSITTNSTDVILDWSGVNWNGALVIDEGNAILKGDNRIRELTVNSKNEIQGSNEIIKLSALPGAEIVLGNATVQKVEEVSFQGSSEKFIIISASGQAAIEFMNRAKLCFDYLNVSSVVAEGNVVVSAGLNSVIVNAANWQQAGCEEVLYADFEPAFNCLGSLGDLLDQSSGDPVQWNWEVTSPSGEMTLSDKQNVQVVFNESGEYTIALKVSNGDTEDEVVKKINVNENMREDNEIIANSETLLSFLQADKYQWFKDGDPVDGAVERSYSYQGEEGVYFVVAYADECNIVSDSLVVTSLGFEPTDEIKVFPNPVAKSFTLSNQQPIRKLEMMNSFGRRMAVSLNSDNSVSVESLSEGLYLIIVHTSGSIHKMKIIVDRD